MATNITSVSQNLNKLVENSVRIDEAIEEIAAISQESAAGWKKPPQQCSKLRVRWRKFRIAPISLQKWRKN